jgi:hypothetical protein
MLRKYQNLKGLSITSICMVDCNKCEYKTAPMSNMPCKICLEGRQFKKAKPDSHVSFKI